MNKGESTKRRAQEAQGGALCLSDRASGRGGGASPGLWMACRGKINLKKRPHLLPGVHYRIPHSLQEIRALGRNMLEKDIF